MVSSWALALGVLVALAAAAGIARQLSPLGTRRNALSVALVVLVLLAVFVACFGLGSLVKAAQAQSKQSRLHPPHELSALALLLPERPACRVAGQKAIRLAGARALGQLLAPAGEAPQGIATTMSSRVASLNPLREALRLSAA